VGPERFKLCRLDVVRVHDPTIISRVLLGVASCNITVLSYGPIGFFGWAWTGINIFQNLLGAVARQSLKMGLWNASFWGR